MAKKAAKKNPQDTTLRNVRAINKKAEELRRRVRSLESFTKLQDDAIGALTKKLASFERDTNNRLDSLETLINEHTTDLIGLQSQDRGEPQDLET